MDPSGNGRGFALRPQTDPFHQAWRTAYFISTFERRRVTRLVLESLEVAFHLCNLYLERYGAGKLFDIINQILPTAYIVNTGYWAFYSCKTGPRICVCTRFGIRCPHLRNEHHWVNMDAFYEYEQNYIFASDSGPSCPNDCQVEVLPVENAFGVYDIRIHMRVLPDNSESAESHTTTLVIEARYGVFPESYPDERKFVNFCPHPLSHPYYARYFSILHSFYDTCTHHDQCAQVFTLGLSGFPNFTQTTNDNARMPAPKLPPCNTFIPNRTPFDQSVMDELSQKFSATLHYASNDSLESSSAHNAPVQNVFMMTNTGYREPAYNYPHANVANNNVVNIHMPGVGNSCQPNNTAGGSRYYTAAQQSNFSRVPPPGQPGPPGYELHAQPPPQARRGRQRQKRGGRRGRGARQENKLREIAPAPQAGPSILEDRYLSSYNTRPERYPQEHSQQQDQYSHSQTRSSRPMQPYQQHPPSSQFAIRSWDHSSGDKAEAATTSAVSHENAEFKPARQEHNNGCAEESDNSNVFQANYDREFPPLKQAPAAKRTSVVRRAPETGTEGKNARNPSLNMETNDLLDDIVEVIEEDMIKYARAIGNHIARNVSDASMRPQYIKVRRTTAIKSEPNASTSEATCTLHSKSEHLLKIKPEPDSDESDSIVILSSEED